MGEGDTARDGGNNLKQCCAVPDHEVHASLAPGDRSLDYSVKDGCAWSCAAGFGESYFGAYVIFLGATDHILGFMSSVPLLAGALAQIAVLALLKRIRFRKRFIVACAICQALTFIPMIILPLASPGYAIYILFVFVVLYHVLGGMSSPAWSSWMWEIVDPAKRGAYFAGRTKIMGIYNMAALFVGGLVTGWMQALGHTWAGFAAIFALACMARLVSSRYLALVTEPAYVPPRHQEEFSLIDFISKGTRSNFLRFVLYVSLMIFASFVAAPFFALYLLEDLKYTYFEYMAVTVPVIAAQYLTLSNWGVISDKFGNRFVLRVCGILVMLVPILWLFSSNIIYIIFIQIFSGIAWGGFNLSAANFIYDAVSHAKVARCVAYFNLFVCIGVVAGAALGGYLIPYLSNEVSVLGWSVSFGSSLQTLFLISGLLRMAVYVIARRSVKEVREVEKTSGARALLYVVGLKAVKGTRHAP